MHKINNDNLNFCNEKNYFQLNIKNKIKSKKKKILKINLFK